MKPSLNVMKFLYSLRSAQRINLEHVWVLGLLSQMGGHKVKWWFAHLCLMARGSQVQIPNTAKKKAPVLGLTKGISQCHCLLGQKTGVTDVKEKPTPTPSFTGNTQTLLDSWNLLSVSRISDPWVSIQDGWMEKWHPIFVNLVNSSSTFYPYFTIHLWASKTSDSVPQ